MEILAEVKELPKWEISESIAGIEIQAESKKDLQVSETIGFEIPREIKEQVIEMQQQII